VGAKASADPPPPLVIETEKNNKKDSGNSLDINLDIHAVKTAAAEDDNSNVRRHGASEVFFITIILGLLYLPSFL